MRSAALLLLLSSCCFAQQQPAEVPVDKEPHHHLVFENEYVRVFKVEVPPHEATLVHRHSRDYVVVTIGDADVTNAVVGKDPKRWNFKDGDVTFLEASGDKSFAHKAVNESEKPFVNYTIELKRPAKNPDVRGGGIGVPGGMTQMIVDAENVGCGKVRARDGWNVPPRNAELAIAIQPREFTGGSGLAWLRPNDKPVPLLFGSNSGEKIFAFCEFR